MKEVKEENLVKIVLTTHHTKTQVILAEMDEKWNKDRQEEGIGFVDGNDYNIEVEGWNVNTIKVLDEYEGSCDCSDTIEDYNPYWCQEHRDQDDCNEKSGMFDGIKIINKGEINE
jgi:hypothetical protein